MQKGKQELMSRMEKQFHLKEHKIQKNVDWTLYKENKCAEITFNLLLGNKRKIVEPRIAFLICVYHLIL